MTLIRRALWALALLFLPLIGQLPCMPASAQDDPAGSSEAGRVIKGEHGTLYLPAGARGHEVWPVLVVEERLADHAEGGRLWPLLSAAGKVIVVETKSQRALARARDGGRGLRGVVDAALVEACNHHGSLNRCPWILVGFSALGSVTARLALEKPGRFQGLLLLSSVVDVKHLPSDLGGAKALKVALLHSREDRVAPIQKAQAVRDRLKGADFDVRMSELAGDDHMAPVRAPGVAFIQAFLRAFPTTTPLAARWFESADIGGRRTLQTKSADDLLITGDLYETGKPSDPIVLLFHQARSGRGEYRLVAPRLVKAGFNCLAIDQRSGSGWGGIRNETAARAQKSGLKQSYVAARPDLERAIAWARELGFTGKLAICGSSYSSALVILIGAETEGIDAVVSFSPGDYLPPRGAIFEAAAKLEVETLILCPPNEEAQARAVLEPIPADKDLVVLAEGVHGASMLYRSPNAETAWGKFLAFLKGTLAKGP